MEAAVIIVVVAILLWYLGLFRPIKVLSEVAVRETNVFDIENKVKAVKRLNKLEVNAEAVSSAQEKLKELAKVNL